MPVTLSSPSDEPAAPNLVTEKLISFAQAAAMFPPFRRGRPVSPSCVWRWFRHGVRLGNKQVVRLEAVRLAGRHLTSVEAVHRFVIAQQIGESALPDRPEDTPTGARLPARRERDSERAFEQLKRLGQGSSRSEDK